LERHIEGGYFRRTFQADQRQKIGLDDDSRYILSSIFYLLTDDESVGHWHCNKSDVIHYHHLGAPINYFMIHPDGRLESATLGADLLAGQQLQLTVPGGVWKASHLCGGDYGLVSEAVSPAFDYRDMTLGDRRFLLELFPQHEAIIRAYTRGTD
jgi:uncharacterized protein